MDEINQASTDNTLDMTADIVAAYVSNNSVPVTDLAALIVSVHASLNGLGNGAAVEPAGPEKATPAQIRKSITPDALISFEDGKAYKTLKRHLTSRGLSAEAYRAKWSLPLDYPMTSANYSAQRSVLAHARGLGQQRKKVAPAPEPTPEPANEITSEKPKRAGRPRKVKEEA